MCTTEIRIWKESLTFFMAAVSEWAIPGQPEVVGLQPFSELPKTSRAVKPPLLLIRPLQFPPVKSALWPVPVRNSLFVLHELHVHWICWHSWVAVKKLWIAEWKQILIWRNINIFLHHPFSQMLIVGSFSWYRFWSSKNIVFPFENSFNVFLLSYLFMLTNSRKVS